MLPTSTASRPGGTRTHNLPVRSRVPFRWATDQKSDRRDSNPRTSRISAVRSAAELRSYVCFLQVSHCPHQAFLGISQHPYSSIARGTKYSSNLPRGVAVVHAEVDALLFLSTDCTSTALRFQNPIVIPWRDVIPSTQPAVSSLVRVLPAPDTLPVAVRSLVLALVLSVHALASLAATFIRAIPRVADGFKRFPALLTTLDHQSWRRESNPQPAAYKAAALPS